MSHHHILGEEQMNALSFFASLIFGGCGDRKGGAISLELVKENVKRLCWNRRRMRSDFAGSGKGKRFDKKGIGAES